jgi:hypothetical protein
VFFFCFLRQLLDQTLAAGNSHLLQFFQSFVAMQMQSVRLMEKSDHVWARDVCLEEIGVLIGEIEVPMNKVDYMYKFAKYHHACADVQPEFNTSDSVADLNKFEHDLANSFFLFFMRRQHELGVHWRLLAQKCADFHSDASRYASRHDRVVTTGCEGRRKGKGNKKGVEKGNDDAFEEGYSIGHSMGFTAGYDKGHDAGYGKGRYKGSTQGENSVADPSDTVAGASSSTDY